MPFIFNNYLNLINYTIKKGYNKNIDNIIVKKNLESINIEEKLQDYSICKIYNNITNNTINNNITYVKFGDEKLSEILSEREMLIILNECRLSVEKSIKLTHFNDNRPELKNIIITNLQNNIGYIFNGEKFEAKPKEIILNDLFDKHLDNIENYISDSDILQNKITNDRLLEKLINKHLPNFINDLNNDKYKLEKLNDVKLLAYNNSLANKALLY